MKKFLIRIIGALCIFGALALMFLPSWVTLDGIDRKDFRNLRKDVVGILDVTSESFVRNAESDAFKEELKDYDLPYTRSSIKSRFKEFSDFAEELLDDKISLQELLTLSINTPGIITDAENLLDSKCGYSFFHTAADYLLYDGTQATGESYDYEVTTYNADLLLNQTQDVIEPLADISFVFILLFIVLVLFLVLGAAAAVTHICNKGRGLKYLFLVILVALVAGSYVAFPIVSELFAGNLGSLSVLEDMELKITVTPIIAVVLMMVPIILDIIFERKKRNNYVEAETNGK